jgi:hypothetical protein
VRKIHFLITAAIAITVLWAGDTPPTFGPWHLVQHTSKMDDKGTSAIVSTASEVDGLPSTVSLLVTCSARKRVQVVLNLGVPVQIESPNSFQSSFFTSLRIRHDKEKAYSSYGFPVGDSVTVGAGIRKDTLAGLKRGSILTAEVQLASGKTGVAVFPVNQFDQAFEALLHGCKAQ